MRQTSLATGLRQPWSTRRARQAASACLFALSVAGLVAPSVLQAQERLRDEAAAGRSDTRPCLDDEQAAQAVALLNALRSQDGAPCAQAQSAATALRWQPRLAATAGEHAFDIALQDALTHVDSKRRSFAVRLATSGYQAAAAGENLAAGQNDLKAAVQAWTDSPTHCKILMSPSYSEVGLACVERPGSRFERFWVAHFAKPTGGTALTR